MITILSIKTKGQKPADKEIFKSHVKFQADPHAEHSLVGMIVL